MLQHTRLPDIFVIGAPKCGTTTIANWLSLHPRVFMCKPKEPHFFSGDVGMGHWRIVKTLPQYRRLFAVAQPQHSAVGEASTSYLMSDVAIPNILALVPKARFVVCLRDPVEMLHSLHAEQVKGGFNTEFDLERTMGLEADRALSGVDVALEPQGLAYIKTCLRIRDWNGFVSNVSSAWTTMAERSLPPQMCGSPSAGSLQTGRWRN